MLHLPSLSMEEDGCEPVAIRPLLADSACCVQLSDGGGAAANSSASLLFARNWPKSRTCQMQASER